MKSTFTLLIFLISSLFFIGQSLELSETQVYLAFDEYLDYDQITATNVGDETITIAVSLEKQCYNSDDGLGIQLCWGDLCYSPTNDDYTAYENEVTLVTLAPGEVTGLISIHQFWVSTYGSTWRIYLYDLNDPTDIVHLDVFVDSCSPDDQVGVTTIQEVKPQLVISPNPATGITSIKYASDAQIIIRDLAGREVQSFNKHQSQSVLELAEFQSGIYLVSVVKSSQIIETQRLIVR